MVNEVSITRRPLKSRDTAWARAIAGSLARAGVRPNAISIMCMVFAAGAGLSLGIAGRTGFDGWQWSVLLLLAALGIQLRLLCNLLDGMVAIEGGLKTKTGEMYNELPDRFADAFIFIGAADSFPQWALTRELGYIAAVLAVITAYVRALGATMGAGQHFLGPMAKPHRMAMLTGSCVIAASAPIWPPLAKVIPVCLALICVGCVITIVRRCMRISREIESR